VTFVERGIRVAKGENSNVSKAQRMVRQQVAAERKRRARILVTVAAVAVLVIAIIVGLSVYKSDQPPAVVIPAGASDVGGTQSGLVAAGNGPVKVEVYFDFLCPFCKQFEATVTPTLDQFVAAGKITLVWHPLGFLDSHSKPTGYSTHAAASSGCASDAGKLKPYGEALFAAQPAEGGPGLSDDQLIDIAGNVGIINPAFSACVRESRYAPWVGQLTNQAVQRGVTATPTVLVNGKPVQPPTAEAITAAVNAAS
jgi:protein-disulfide isomerase